MMRRPFLWRTPAGVLRCGVEVPVEAKTLKEQFQERYERIEADMLARRITPCAALAHVALLSIEYGRMSANQTKETA